VAIVSFIATLGVIIQTPSVQTFMVRMASDHLSRQTKLQIRVGSFGLSFTKGLLIRDLMIVDRNHDDMISVHLLGLRPGRIQFRQHKINIEKIFIDKGVFQLLIHKNDSLLNLRFLLDYFASRDTIKKTDTSSLPWHITFSKVELTDSRFHYQDENAPKADTGMDFANIDVSHINLLITDFHPEGDTINANIKRLNAVERSGFAIRSMSGEFHVSPAFLKAHHLKLVTNNCDLDLSFDFLYKEWNDYSDFLTKVKIRANISPSDFDLEDIGAFAPVLYPMKDKFRISGDLKGSVSSFHATNFRIGFGSDTRFFGNISAIGLPNVEETFADINIKSFVTTVSDINSFRLPGDAGVLALPAFLLNAGTCNLKGTFTGFYNDFAANARLSTDIGAITTDLSLRKPKGHQPISYQGEVDIAGFNLGNLLDSRATLGKVSLRADISGEGLNLKQANLLMNVHVDSAGLNNYTYRNIDIRGSLKDEKFDGLLASKDPNLLLDFNGLIDFSDSLPSFDFTSTVHHANLYATHLLARDSILSLSTRISVKFTGTNIDNIDGDITLDHTRYIEGSDTINMEHLAFLSQEEKDNNKSYHLKSDFADADFTGEFRFRSMIPSLVAFIQNYLASFKRHDSLISQKYVSGQFIKFKVALKKTDAVCRVFIPFLRIAPDTRLEGFFSDDPGLITITGSSPELTVFGMHFNNWFLKATNRVNNLTVRTGCRRLDFRQRRNQDSLLISIDSVQLSSDMREDSVMYKLTWFDPHSHSEINGFMDLGKSPAIEIKVKKLNVYFDRKYWTIAADNDIIIDTSAITLNNMEFEAGEQYLRINGKIAHTKSDTLLVSFNKVDISDADELLGNQQVNLDGILSGKLKLTNVYDAFTVLSDLRVDKFKFNGEPLGDATFAVSYASEAKRFDVVSQILYTGNVGVSTPFLLKGSVYLAEANPHLDLDMTLKNLNLKMVAPFVSSFMTGVSGLVSGDLKIKGALDRPVMIGKLNLMRTELKINYLNVPYSLADVVTVDSNYFGFNRITVFDSLGNKAFLSGKILHDHFSNIRLDLSLDFKDFSAFRNSYAQNNLFYGNARASGNVKITGPIDNIVINVRAESGNTTHVMIPIASAADVGQNDYIIFKAPEKDSLKNLKGHAVPQGGLSLFLSLLVNPNADVEVYFPSNLGNIKATGTGNLLMNLTPTTSFELSGIYTLQKGSFLFQLKNYMRMAFTIQPGGNISWAGDPVDASIAVGAVYKTRVTLQGLTTDADKTSLRFPVEVIIRLHGKLMNPDITFGMSMPNAAEDVKSIVYSAIDTTNQAVMTEQALNILVLNQFKSVQGGTSSDINVSSTSFAILSNQVNSMLSKVSKDVNLGVNYQRGTTNATPQELDVSVSTSLFSDRLLVDGLFGVSSYTSTSTGTSSQVSTIVGDINIEYLLTKNGRLRLKAFNRTNTIDLLTNNAPYTQGLGISYQRDFNNIGELFRSSKKQKTEPPKK
jgi:hypothetical protein